jgi:hypothetical protein
MCSRSSRALVCLTLASLVGCARHNSPAVPVAPRPAPAVTAAPLVAREVDRPASPAATELAALSPLFARRVGCVNAQRVYGFQWTHAVDGGRESRALSADEVRARPWLWGQSGSGCAETSLNALGIPSRDEHPGLAAPSASARATTASERYLAWARVDDLQRWAPLDCRLPPASAPRVDLGASAPHGRKVYFLYARDRAAYLSNRDVPGQIVVKEAWVPREVSLSEAVFSGYTPQCRASSEGRCVEPGAFAGLFVMMRVGAEHRADETDAGWTYATVDPQGTVTASGRIASCMRCHARAPHGRLFGLAPGDVVGWR